MRGEGNVGLAKKQKQNKLRIAEIGEIALI
jgi:hypothetical protein